MTPGKLNLTIYAGVAMPAVRLVCKDADGALSDLTGLTADLDARPSLDLPVAFSLAVTVDEEESALLIQGMTSQQTAALPVGRFVHDLVLIQDGQRLGPLLAGHITVQKIVSRD